MGDKMDYEEKYLSKTIQQIDEMIDDDQIKISRLVDFYGSDYDKILEERNFLENEINILDRVKENPYFARIDFETEKNKDICYIGKKGIVDYDNNIITVDWIAPISSLYYDSNIGSCSYSSPTGIVNGVLQLKRQYDIEKGKLINYVDVDTVSNDELLKPYLSVSADSRLNNIVSTIQSEQNSIIRKNINKNLIVQGVAGSGKTTVALHRIAYLVYSNRNVFSPRDYMIIGPNKFFINYISNVLPELDVNGVSEYTLDELLCNFLADESFNINNYLDEIDKNHSDQFNIKTSMDMKKIIDNYFLNLNLIPSGDFKIDNHIIIDKETVRRLYSDISDDKYPSVVEKIDRAFFLIKNYFEIHKSTIFEKLIRDGIKNDSLIKLKSNYSKLLRNYLYFIETKIKKIYISILKDNNFDYSDIACGNINFVDIPSILYIAYKFYGNKKYINYKQIVIDEAQDYGVFMFYVLKKIFSNATFSIYGDLAQSIYSFRSIKKWSDIIDFYDDVELINLNKSYRTTIEIMNEANKINRLLNLPEAIPVIRHGKEVVYTNDSLKNIVFDLLNKYKNVAIITKTSKTANEVYNKLLDCYNYSKEINLIDSSKLSFESGLNILPSHLSKGLEFDAVILLDKDEFDYSNSNDLKLLYVSMTRALHELYVMDKLTI